MTLDPDTMTTEQLRDALAVAAGWFRGLKFATPTGVSVKTGSWGKKINEWQIDCQSEHPIPPLDSPEALGVVAGMIPGMYCLAVYQMRVPSRDVWQAVLLQPFSDAPVLSADGPTETVARARLVLKILACSKPNSSPARPS